MASSKNGTALTQGQVAGVTFYEREGITIARAAHNKRTNPGRTEANMKSRTKTANLISNWRVLKPCLQDCFEDRKPLASEYNGFLSNNLSRTQVHLSKEESEGQVAVADWFVVSHGSLPGAVQVEMEGDWLVSDLKVSRLANGGRCSLYEFGVALMEGNPGRVMWGDEIRYVALRQGVDINTRRPVTAAAMCRVRLDEMDPRRLSAVVEGQLFQEGFSMEEGCLRAPCREGWLGTWIVLRPQRKGRPRVTTQQLVGRNAVLERYTSEKALRDAIESY